MEQARIDLINLALEPEIKTRKKACQLVSQASGMSFSFVQHFLNGISKDMRVKSLDKLRQAILAVRQSLAKS